MKKIRRLLSFICVMSFLIGTVTMPLDVFAKTSDSSNTAVTQFNAESTALYVYRTGDGRELIFPTKEDYDLYLQAHQLTRAYGEEWRLQTTLAKKNLSHHFVGYHSGTPNWAPASSYTISKGKNFSVGGSYSWEGVTLNLGFSYSFSVATTIPADASRYSRLGVFADYTLKKERYAQYQYGKATGLTRVSTYAERTAKYIEPVYK